MSQKVRVGVIFGGKSAEHEVSLQSAKNIVDAIDKEKYEVLLLGIDKEGKWHVNTDTVQYLLHAEDPKLIQLNHSNEGLALIPGAEKYPFVSSQNAQSLGQVDVVFPVLHGPFGEDGTVQGLLKLANLPFVGSGVLGSAVSMDKDVAKRLLRDAGINVADFVTVTRSMKGSLRFEKVVEQVGLPFFVKPANLGSSVGVNKVKDEGEFEHALAEAFRFDHKVLLERLVQGREIECSVLGNEDPVASILGEILPHQDFYSYEAKYIDEQGAGLQIPADLAQSVAVQMQETAVQAFRVLGCQGMARVDFFLEPDGKIIINEVNTIPGFTKISMYPKLWEASGLPYTQLIDRLIQLAIERFDQDQALQNSY